MQSHVLNTFSRNFVEGITLSFAVLSFFFIFVLFLYYKFFCPKVERVDNGSLDLLISFWTFAFKVLLDICVNGWINEIHLNR